jgi:hypothetical protein
MTIKQLSRKGEPVGEEEFERFFRTFCEGFSVLEESLIENATEYGFDEADVARICASAMIVVAAARLRRGFPKTERILEEIREIVTLFGPESVS